MNENKHTIKSLCEAYGMGQTALSRRFGVPIRTVQDWYSGRSNAPSYVVGMIAELLEHDSKARAEGIYLVYKDSIDDACTIVGYIRGTGEDADEYCNELDKDAKYTWEEHTWERLDNLLESKAEQE